MFTSNNFVNGFQVAEKGMEEYLNLCFMTMDSLFIGQKHMESVFHNCLEKNKDQSEATLKMLDDFMAQAKNNQQYCQNLWRDSIIQMIDCTCTPNYSFFTDFCSR